jgi:hypothetical protein
VPRTKAIRRDEVVVVKLAWAITVDGQSCLRVRMRAAPDCVLSVAPMAWMTSWYGLSRPSLKSWCKDWFWKVRMPDWRLDLVKSTPVGSPGQSEQCELCPGHRGTGTRARGPAHTATTHPRSGWTTRGPLRARRA